MKIDKAIRLAMVQGKGIKRDSEPCDIWFLPSNSLACIIIMDSDKPLSQKWNPKADDLMATDWKTY